MIFECCYKTEIASVDLECIISLYTLYFMRYTVRNMVSTKSNNPGKPQGIEIELNFWQFVRKYRWWTVARRSVPNVSIMSSFSCANLNHYPFAHPDAILPPTGLFRCHPSTHYSIPMPPFHPVVHPDATCTLPSVWCSRYCL